MIASSRLTCLLVSPSWSKVVFERILAALDWEERVIRSDDGAFDQVLQFADVSRPTIGRECCHCFWWNEVNRLARAPSETLDKMRNQLGNVIRALSQRRSQSLAATWRANHISLCRWLCPNLPVVRLRCEDFRPGRQGPRGALRRRAPPRHQVHLAATIPTPCNPRYTTA